MRSQIVFLPTTFLILLFYFLYFSVGISLVAITAAAGSTTPQSHQESTTQNYSTKMYSSGSSLTNNSKRMDSNNANNKNVSKAIEILRNSDIVCFDVDSTVIKEEGIDELAKFCGKGAEVERLTREAMGGSMTFQEALRLRLNIIKPTQKQISEFLMNHPSTITPGLR